LLVTKKNLTGSKKKILLPGSVSGIKLKFNVLKMSCRKKRNQNRGSFTLRKIYFIQITNTTYARNNHITAIDLKLKTISSEFNQLN
jgi:hypothetical protein